MRWSRATRRISCEPVRIAAAVFVSIVLLSAANPALGDVDANACIDASETGQRARNASDLLTARSLFETCADRECPHVVREDCVRWVDEVIQQTPSIVVAAVDRAGKDVFDGRILVDGREISAELDGKEIPLNPGTRSIEVVRADGSRLAEKILVRAGQKRRIVTLRSPSSAAAASPAVPSTSADPSRPKSFERRCIKASRRAARRGAPPSRTEGPSTPRRRGGCAGTPRGRRRNDAPRRAAG